MAKSGRKISVVLARNYEPLYPCTSIMTFKPNFWYRRMRVKFKKIYRTSVEALASCFVRLLVKKSRVREHVPCINHAAGSLADTISSDRTRDRWHASNKSEISNDESLLTFGCSVLVKLVRVQSTLIQLYFTLVDVEMRERQKETRSSTETENILGT